MLLGSGDKNDALNRDHNSFRAVGRSQFPRKLRFRRGHMGPDLRSCASFRVLVLPNTRQTRDMNVVDRHPEWITRVQSSNGGALVVMLICGLFRD